MNAAYQRALAFGAQQIQTSASGDHIPTVVLTTPSKESSRDIHSLIQRLSDQHTVRWEPLCQEAATALEYLSEQYQINLAELDAAHEVMTALHRSLLEIKQATYGWPWEIRGNDGDKRAEEAMNRYRGLTHE